MPAPPQVVPRPRADDPRFYEWMASACAFIAFAGLVPTYWPVAAGTFAGAPILMSDA